MKKSRDVVGLSVIELDEGKSLGKVHSLVFNPASRVVEALEVGEKSLLKSKTELIPISQVRSFGNDAITLQNYESILEGEKTAEASESKRLIGSRVISADGTMVGTVDDFTFAKENGAIIELYISPEKAKGHLLIPINSVNSFGRDFIVVDENYHADAKEIEAPSVEKATRQLVHSLEVRAIEYALNREAGQDVFDDNGQAIIRKGEVVTSDTIDLARQKNRLTQLLIAAGTGELLDGIDFTKEKLDSGSRKLIETWQSLRDRSQEWLTKKLDDDRLSPTGELRDLWVQLQGKLAQGSRELEESTKEKIRNYVLDKTLAHPVYDKEGILLADKDETVTLDISERAEQSGRLPQLFLATAANDVQLALDPIKKQIKDVLNEWDKKE